MPVLQPQGMSATSHPETQPWQTRNGHEVSFDVRPDAIGLPRVENAYATHKYTGVRTRLSETQVSEIQQVMMTHEIAKGARGQAEASAATIAGYPEVVVRYGGEGIDAHRKVNKAMTAMSDKLEAESVAVMHTFLHQIDNQMDGIKRADFAAPGYEPQGHGLPLRNHENSRSR